MVETGMCRTVFVVKPAVKQPTGRLRGRQEDNIKMDLKDI
jgi:hypothetical protein